MGPFGDIALEVRRKSSAPETESIYERPADLMDVQRGSRALVLSDIIWFVERSQELLESLRVLGEISMTWWVSATVLCATIVGVTWSQRDEIRKSGRLLTGGVMFLGLVFFATICGYGFTAISGTYRLRSALLDACGPGRACTQQDAMDLALTTTTALWIGTSSFVLFGIAWIGILGSAFPRKERPDGAAGPQVKWGGRGLHVDETVGGDNVEQVGLSSPQT